MSPRTRVGPPHVLASDVVVVGAGIAGLSTALDLMPASVAVLAKGEAGADSASVMAQGGIASAVGADDEPRLHAGDTLAVGAGLGDPAAVEILTRSGPARIADLVAWGARFDRDPDGGLALGLEAAHSRRRVLHSGGDATGRELVRALISRAERQPSIQIFSNCRVVDLVVRRGRVEGVSTLSPEGRRIIHLARAVVLATGGIGQLFGRTTNPVTATGDGLAMAARGGAVVVDCELVQFHPTALAAGGDPMPLLTEALRGEGAVLVDEVGERFLLGLEPEAELAPRDRLARAVWRHQRAGHEVYLDARRAVGENFPRRFPTVFESCLKVGIDPRVDRMPVSPAAHFHMGGVWTDEMGRTSLPGLWACGEVASTGVHGANRLASNSLLEGLVYGRRTAGSVARELGAGGRRGLMGAWGEEPAGNGADDEAVRDELREVMWRRVALERDRQGLESALRRLSAAQESLRTPEGRNLALVGRLVATAALARRESRGSHFRTDHPQPDPAQARRLAWRLVDGHIEPATLPSQRPATQAEGAGR